MNTARILVGRKKLREEKVLAIRVILSVCLNVVYYSIFGSLFLYNFVMSSTNQKAIFIIDIVLLLRSMSAAVLLTFATKSFVNVLKRIGSRKIESRLQPKVWTQKKLVQEPDLRQS